MRPPGNLLPHATQQGAGRSEFLLSAGCSRRLSHSPAAGRHEFFHHASMPRSSPATSLTGGISFLFQQILYYIEKECSSTKQEKNYAFSIKNRRQSLPISRKLRYRARVRRQAVFLCREQETARSAASGDGTSFTAESYAIPLRIARFFIRFLGRPHLVIHRLDAVAVAGMGAQPAAEGTAR